MGRLYYPFSENKGADQLRSYNAADQCAFVMTYAKSRFSHDAAQIIFRSDKVAE